MSVTKSRFAAIMPVIALIAACDSSTDPDGSGRANVFLARSTSTVAASIGTNSSDDLIMSSGPVTLSMVDSVFVRVIAVHAHRANQDTTSESSWARMDLTGQGGTWMNLMALPREGTDSTQVATEQLEEGTYDQIRLLVDDSARIVLNQDVSFGGTVRLTRGSHPLRIPSGETSGLKLRGSGFTISEDSTSTVTIVFDNASSVGNITFTGSGTAIMSPVLRKRN